MNKAEVLELDRNAHLSVREIAASNQTLAPVVKTELNRRATETVVKRFASGSNRLRNALKSFQLDIDSAPADRSFDSAAMRALFAHLGTDEKLRKEAEKLAADIDKARGKAAAAARKKVSLADTVGLNRPVAFHPAFREPLRAAQIYKLADTVRLKSSIADVLVDEIGSINRVDDDSLARLVKARKLTNADAARAAEVVSLYRIADERPALAAELGRGEESIRQLAAKRTDEIVDIIRRSGAEPPLGLSIEDHADSIQRKLETLFPTDALRARINAGDSAGALVESRKLDPLRERNRGVRLTEADFSALDTSGLSRSQVRTLKAARDETVAMIHRYPGMRLGEVIDNSRINQQRREAEIRRRIAIADRVMAANPDVLGLDLTPGSSDIKALRFPRSTSQQYREMAMANIRAYQRVYAITKDATDNEQLLSKGFSSSFAVVAAGKDRFTVDSGLPGARADQYFQAAKNVVIGLAGRAGIIADGLRSGSIAFAMENVPPSVQAFLKELPGYADLFGNQNYCQCQHCQSILSPAAYFVDLMCLVEDKITATVFEASPDHPLNLRTRRPDLWTLELTCENTHTELPYLQVIAEVLEVAVAVDSGFSGDLADRSAVATHVYKTVLPDVVDSFAQPYLLPFEEVRIFLRHFDRTLGDIAEAANAPGDTLARLRLEMTQAESDLTTQPDVTPAWLKRLYGIDFSESGGKIQAFDAQLLLPPMDVSREQLSHLVEAAFVTDDGNLAIAITGEKLSSDSVQNDVERIHELTWGALDRMHRLVRLWRKTQWSIAELDLVLSHLDMDGLGSNLDRPALRNVARARELQSRIGESVEETIALWSRVPQRAGTDAVALFDRLFNQDAQVAIAGSLPNPAVQLLHPALAAVPPAAGDPNVYRLQTATGTDEDGLYQLLVGLAPRLGIDLASGNDADKEFPLTVDNLSLIYRHSQLAKRLELAIPDLFLAAGLAPGVPAGHVDGLDSLEALVDFLGWLDGCGWSLSELAALVAPGPAAGDGSASDLADRIVADVAAARMLQFAETVFATLDGVTEDQSRELISLNAARLEAVAGTDDWRLKANFNASTALALPAGIDPTLEPELRAILLSYHSKAILLALLPGGLGALPERVAKMVDLLAVNLSSPAMFRALRGDTVPDLIRDLIVSLQRLAGFVADEAVFDADTLDWMNSNKGLFGIADFNAIGTTNAQAIDLFRQLSEPWTQAQPGEAPDLKTTLKDFTAVAGFAAANQQDLARLLGCDEALISSLNATLSLGATPFAALSALRSAVEMALYIGLSGSGLALSISSDYDELTSASIAIQAAIRSKYDREDEWIKAVTPYADRVLSKRRDGLVAYLVHTGTPQFDEVTDLYRYYLLDVELEGCARTSRVAAAIASLQLYVERCRLNLEESPPDAADHVHVAPGLISDTDWEWRKNYRIWEANRKVFLYPENWIEPDLRDNKTFLFRELEDELLANEITEDTVVEAYARYLRGFDELAHLKIAGSFHEKDDDAKTDTLHLIGVSADEPPTYFYRRVEDAHYGVSEPGRATRWNAWKKIDIQIPSRRVAPIVYNGRLYIFWTRYVTKPINKVSDGAAIFAGYEHRLSVEYSVLRLDGRWSPPQKIQLTERPFKDYGDGLIPDPVVIKDAAADEESIFDGFLSDWFPNLPRIARKPLYDDEIHKEPIEDYTLSGYAWDQVYPSAGDQIFLRGANFQLASNVDFYNRRIKEPIDYSGLTSTGDDPGVPWFPPGLWIFIILLTFGQVSPSEMLPDRFLWSRRSGSNRILHSDDTNVAWLVFDSYTQFSLILERERIENYTESLTYSGDPQWHEDVTDHLLNGLTENHIATLPAEVVLDVVNGSVEDAIIQTTQEVFYLQEGVREDGKYLLRRLGSSVSEEISKTLYTDGLDRLLSTDYQESLKERSHGLSPVESAVFDGTSIGSLDYGGAAGVYLREIFFHIPFLIANHLNSQGKFELAQHWYRFIFDPTSGEVITGLPGGLSEEERRQRELDRVWRYLEFRDLTPETLRAHLTDVAAIEEYKREPFNPHAIARLRLSAYQKSIVMKYVDNLLDWGDHLFGLAYALSNREYLGEATLLYVQAQEILGKRPAELGDCGEGELDPKTFETIKPLLVDGSTFLMEMESWVLVPLITMMMQSQRFDLVTEDRARGATQEAFRRLDFTKESTGSGTPALLGIGTGLSKERSRSLEREGRIGAVATAEARRKPELVQRASAVTYADVTALSLGARAKAASVPRAGATAAAASTGAAGNGLSNTLQLMQPTFGLGMIDSVLSFGFSLLQFLNPIFCVPDNQDMLGYWDRVEDRLYKLRNCMDIDGVRRSIPLFAPPIDPGLLVRARAAGLSLEDVLSAGSGYLPPYRFRYLHDKAKGYIAAVQGFGTALMSALEKRDAEELATIRNRHQKNILALSKEVKQNELLSAEENLLRLQKRKESIDYKVDYYEHLISTGRIASEDLQTGSVVLGSLLRGGAGVLDTAAAIAFLVPQVGSPFAMKYGGDEIGKSGTTWAEVLNSAADVADAIASASGLQAEFARREEGWEHQLKLVKFDRDLNDKDILGAELRVEIARRAVEIHDKSVEQHDEILEYYGDKFSNLGLYTWLSRSLQQLHREAYDSARAMAALAERAYHFERPGDAAVYIGGEWDASRSGLQAGDRLMLSLQRMERRFIETDLRSFEVNQSFSLAQVNPIALIKLKETGVCDFTIPELFFDLVYPGQHNRRIKAVRLTIPCITGPYTNVGAKLSLTGSSVRLEPQAGAAHLLPVPLTRTHAVAISTAQGDAGVFDLNFRDERYVPFEGAGAVSNWTLELPSSFRPFDYQTITDVILNISYTADEDGDLRTKVEAVNAALEGSLRKNLKNNALTRVFSFRQEYSGAFTRLLNDPEGTGITFDIGDRHFPLFLQGSGLTAVAAKLVLGVAPGQSVNGVKVSVDGTVVQNLSPDAAVGDLPAKSLGGTFSGGINGQHTIEVVDAGDLTPDSGHGAVDPDKLRDVLLILQYRLA